MHSDTCTPSMCCRRSACPGGSCRSGCRRRCCQSPPRRPARRRGRCSPEMTLPAPETSPPMKLLAEFTTMPRRQIAEVRRAADVEADVVALDGRRGRTRSAQQDAETAVARDDVPSRRGRPADAVARPVDPDTVRTVRARQRASRIGADEVGFDDVARALDHDPGAAETVGGPSGAEPVDGETTDDTAVRLQLEAVAVRPRQSHHRVRSAEYRHSPVAWWHRWSPGR